MAYIYANSDDQDHGKIWYTVFIDGWDQCRLDDWAEWLKATYPEAVWYYHAA